MRTARRLENIFFAGRRSAARAAEKAFSPWKIHYSDAVSDQSLAAGQEGGTK